MKIFVVGDVHWSTYSSILRTRNKDCSTRLSNLLSSIDWAEDKALETKADLIVYLGDFFDRCDINSEEISVLQKINWAKSIRHAFIVGNHESSMIDLQYSSTNALRKEGFEVIDKIKIEDDIAFIPYFTEDTRRPLSEILPNDKKRIVFSHNDISGIRYGAYESKFGYSLDEIKGNTSLYVNGHLHNQTKFFDGKRLFAINLGNLTGQNFSEDAFRYGHQTMLIDTDTLETSFFDNPHAFNFYKLDVVDETSLRKLDDIKQNAVLSLRCDEKYVDRVNEILTRHNVVTYKMTIVSAKSSATEDVKFDYGTDGHLGEFDKFVIDRLGKTDIVMSELGEVCRR